jgi:hypothetical protein
MENASLFSMFQHNRELCVDLKNFYFFQPNGIATFEGNVNFFS